MKKLILLLFCAVLLADVGIASNSAELDGEWPAFPSNPHQIRHAGHIGRNDNHGPMPSNDFLYNSYSTNPARAARQQTAPPPQNGQLGNRKPVFVNCSKYHATVKEEQPAGTTVLQVTALDSDPPQAGGTVTYTFVSAPGERLKFSIGPDTGLISTSSTFDRDEPSREKEMYLTVRATDNGRPQLDDVCTIKVTITDVNDNRPVFDKVNYVESVPQDLRPGSEVMRISATDIDDGNNSIVVYELEPRSENDRSYFRIDKATGVIYLNRTLSDRDPGYRFRMNATASDLGTPPRSTHIELEILVVESHKKAPSFTYVPEMPIKLKENYNDYQTPIATITAESNIPEEELVFMIVNGRTEQTNQRNTFVQETKGSTVHIKLGRSLDYEAITEYTITVRVQNKYNLAAETVLNIQVLDVNDNIPVFTEVVSGTVLEHEPRGGPVMQVRAIDADGTSDHNQVTYELGDHQDLFSIDRYTGNITTNVMFDREEKDFYIVKVIASDNSPSALLSTGEPNRGQQVFHIEIGDINDNAPHFTKKVYVADAVEDANSHMLIAEVTALDNDTASDVTYSIEKGNTYEAFFIEKNTGKIRVNNNLDYENTTSYTLTVRAFDGRFEDYATVEIKIENVNDNRPVFLPFQKNVNIEEEALVTGCIAKLEAYDPDIPNRNDPQHIKYYIVKEDQQKLLEIDDSGCLKLIKPLDRDPPNGYPQWQVLISAKDEDGGPSSLSESTEVIVDLTDINDNAPYLSLPQPVVWGENQPPGVITKLEASDNDSAANGPPFEFELDPNASPDILMSFKITTLSSGTSQIEALKTFDREQQKMYMVPIVISDSGQPTSMTGTSTLTIVIGDENDNAMKPGSSEIFVYNYKGLEGTIIGRVYVEDLDDWDLPDKSFAWKNGNSHPNYELNTNTGELTVVGNPKGDYFLEFTVVEESSLVPRHSVDASVSVTVKEIPEVAVDRSGSIRLVNITAQEFVEPAPGKSQSRREMLRDYLAKYFNISADNVDVFTVLHGADPQFLDVRFSAHSSPYYQPEKLNGAVAQHQQKLEELLNVTVWMVNIDECLVEKKNCESSCSNRLEKYDTPYTVYTNTSSFVGVDAQVIAECTCGMEEVPICLNGGTQVGASCECPEGYDGPHCETIDVGFAGDGWAWYPPLQACEKAHLSLELQANKDDGLVFYVGPLNAGSSLKVQDFMSLELAGGYARLLVDYGSGTVRLEQRQVKLTDGQKHHIEIQWNVMNIELKVDSCSMGSCLALSAPEGPNQFLNVNGPLQLGGTSMSLRMLGQQYGWNFTPTEQGLSGCVRNFTFNSKVYNLGEPSHSKNAIAGCDRSIAKAVTFGIDTNFLVAILVCIAVLLILVLAVVVHRRRSDDMFKDQDDIRENIINYEDEGGGEGDMTGYDLNVLRLVYDGQPDEKLPQRDIYAGQAPDEVPDICGFLDGKKRQVDDDPDAEPFDNVRHYAYEGDGDSVGSLSSLASGTDEGDLNFDYLSDFGPRFRKLADMYGEHSSDESEENFAPGGASESWC